MSESTLNKNSNPFTQVGRNFDVTRLNYVNIGFEWKTADGEKGNICFALDSDVQKFHLMDEGYTKQEVTALLKALFEKLNEKCVVKETKKKSKRDQIISSMCYSVRHDYGLTKDENSILSSGLTEAERKALWANMEQIYDNVIVPHFLQNENS